MPKFLHAADLHIDSPLRGLAFDDESVNAQVRIATRDAFERLLALAVREEVCFLLLAGDVLDGKDAALKSTNYLYRELGRLHRDHGIPTFMVRGNHDPAELFPRKVAPPEGVHIFADAAAESKAVPGADVVIHGQSYAVVDVTEDLSAGYPCAEAGKLNIGVLHTALDPATSGKHARYAPTTAPLLASKGYAYWALGHVHTRNAQRHGDVHIVFPGNLQSRHVAEADEYHFRPGEASPPIAGRGATLVEYEGVTIKSLRHVPCDVVRWLHLYVDVTGCDSTEALRARFVEAVDAAQGQSASELRAVLLRVELVGRSFAADAWRADIAKLTEELKAAVIGTRSAGQRTQVIESVRTAELVPLRNKEHDAALLATASAVLDELRGQRLPTRQNLDMLRRYAATDEVPERVDDALLEDVYAIVRAELAVVS